MSKWEEEFVRMHDNSTRKIERVTRHFRETNKKEAERMRKVLRRFSK